MSDLPTQTTYPHAPRGRRTSHHWGDDRRQAILTTAERLLQQRPLADFSVDDLAKGAGISRPTFYFYFRSKTAVLLSLFDSMNGKADAALRALGGTVSGDPHKPGGRASKRSSRCRGLIGRSRWPAPRRKPPIPKPGSAGRP